MLCLSINQPYPYMICVLGDKPVENRDWPCSYRGRLLLHAGKTQKRLADWELYYPGQPLPGDLAFGAIIGGGRLVNVFHIDQRPYVQTRPGYEWVRDCPHVQGPYCFVLDKVHCLRTPIPYRGRERLFTVPDEVVQGAEWIQSPGLAGQEIPQ